jgi:glucose/arabinose dehydrogenase
MKELVLGLVLLSLIPVALAQEYPELEVKVEVVADNLTIPWSIDWLPDGTILFTERNGDLRIIQHGVLLQEPLLSLSVGGVEGGMLGITVDPNYSENNYIYLYYTYNELLTTKNKLVRYQFSDGILVEDKILIDGIPGGPFQNYHKI